MGRLIATTGAAVALTFALTVSAQAQEMTEDAPFSGLYVGAAGGYDVQPNDVGSRILFDRNLDGRFGDTVTTIRGTDAFSPGFCNGSAKTATPAGGCRNDADGAAYYGRVGFDQQRGHIVVGFVGEFGKTEITDSVSGYSTTPASYVLSRKVDYEGSIRGRAGYAVNTTLFYGSFGAGYARINRLFATTNTANAFTESGRQNQFGFLGGGGIEQKINKHVSIGLEYMYHQYRDNDFRVRATAGPAISGSPILLANNPFVIAPNTTGTDFRRSDDKFRWHSLRATASFRF